MKRGTTKGAINLEEKSRARELKEGKISKLWTMEIERRSFTMEKSLGTKKQTGTINV